MFVIIPCKDKGVILFSVIISNWSATIDFIIKSFPR